MNQKLLFTVIIVCFVCRHHAFGQTCCSGGIPVSNTLGLPYMGQDGFQLGGRYDLNELSNVKHNSKSLDDNDRRRLTQSLFLLLGYTINQFSFELTLPYVFLSRSIKGNDGKYDNKYSTGIGDAIVLVRYHGLFPKQSLWSASIGTGLGIPTGSDSQTDGNGFHLNADLQPGSGALNYILFSSVQKKIPNSRNVSLFAQGSLILKSTNSDFRPGQDYQFGNESSLQAGISGQFFVLRHIFRPSLSLFSRKAEIDRVNKNELPNTGGYFLFVNPSISIPVYKKGNIDFSADLPVYSKAKGTQVVTSFRLNIGFQFTFAQKSSVL